ncbi:dynein light chain Tctex-type protein 2B-like [Tachypleus tridentatus]|uniref:dynein light chain Tctex-type protein 2B-like n=1 Tax=Tachypleus tridentatus TaxID=6853 RepID=UPI003FD1F0F7
MSKIEPNGDDSVSTYNIRPSLDQKFRSAPVKECIRLILMEELGDKSYRAEDVPVWTKELGFERYKMVVQVVIGEQRGEGVRIGSRCLWDSDTDNYASDIFMNDSLFCVATAFATYYY